MTDLFGGEEKQEPAAETVTVLNVSKYNLRLPGGNQIAPGKTMALHRDLVANYINRAFLVEVQDGTQTTVDNE